VDDDMTQEVLQTAIATLAHHELGQSRSRFAEALNGRLADLGLVPAMWRLEPGGAFGAVITGTLETGAAGVRGEYHTQPSRDDVREWRAGLSGGDLDRHYISVMIKHAAPGGEPGSEFLGVPGVECTVILVMRTADE
jgi:hypothetical protein